MRHNALVLCAVLLGAHITVPAHAAGVDPANATPVQREQANARFLKGKAHFDRNDFSAALEDFRASLDMVASPNARLYVARTLREMGRLVEAYVEFGRTAAEAKEHEHEDGRYGKAAEAALAERAAVAPQIGFVNLNVTNANESTAVSVAGSQILRGGWGEPVPVKPGEVEVEVITPGVLPIRRSVVVHAGQKAAVTVDAKGQAGVALSTGGTTSSSSSTGTGGTTTHAGKGWMLPAAIAGGGVGVVGLVMFTVAGIASSSTYSDLKTKCGLAPCPSNLQGEVADGKTQQAIANTGLVIGIIGVVAGAAFLTLWLLPSHHGSASAGVTFGPGSLGLRGEF
jgi:hypothetical protein